MTAINVLMLDREVHVFSDGAYYDAGDLRTICGAGNKVIPLPAVNGFLAWSGPLDGLYRTLGWIERSGHFSLPDLLGALPSAMCGLRLPADYSAIVCGLHTGSAMGVSCEGSGKVHRLSPGSVVKSLACDSQFDITDIEGSGVRILDEQKARYDVVGAFAQHHVFADGGHTARTLKRWPVSVRGSGLPMLAKIANLSVETLNIDPSAVQVFSSITRNLSNGYNNTTNLTAANPESAPVQVYCNIHVQAWGSAPGNTGVGYVDVTVTRLSPSEVIYSGRFERAFNGEAVQEARDSFYAIDDIAGSGQTYQIWMQAGVEMTSPGGGTVGGSVTLSLVSTTR